MSTQNWVLLGSGAGLGAGIGAGLMYLLDPEGGEKRRALVRDKASQAIQAGGESLRQASRELGERGRDLYATAGSHLREGEKRLEIKVQKKAKNLPALAGNGRSKHAKLTAARLVGVALSSVGLGLLASGGRRAARTA